MKERPILFSGQMVQAILEGRKTQTRRVVKATGIALEHSHGDPTPRPSSGYLVYRDGEAWDDADGISQPIAKSPYGQAGDRLWVREGHLIDGWYDGQEGDLPLIHREDRQGVSHTILYRSDYPDLRAIDDDGDQRYRKDGSEASPWKSSRFMPKWAARLWLEITRVRVERLKEITEEAAIAEGIEKTDWPYSCEPYRNYLIPDRRPGCNKSTAVASYYSLWESINGKTHPWSENPWVWVIEFKREGGQT